MGQTARLRLDQPAEGCTPVWAGSRTAGKSAVRPPVALLIAGDVAAAALAFASCALIVLWSLPSAEGLDARMILVWALPAFAALGWLGTRGRAGRRAPVRTMVIGGLVGVVVSVLLGLLLLPASYLVVVPAMAWLAFPAAGLALRALLGQPATLVGLRGSRRAAVDAVARLRERLAPFDRQLVDRQLAVAAPARDAAEVVSMFPHGCTAFTAGRRSAARLLARVAADGANPARSVPPGREPGWALAGPAADLRRRPVAQFCKSGFDVAAAVAALLFLAPLLIVLGVLVRLDGGPVLFAHTRVGRGGNRFPCLKFRSMVVDADAVLRRLLESDPQAAQEWAATQKLRHDPRITWIGRVLRKTSVDELPQLLNVIRREMSLVGPRPIVAAEVARYGQDIVYYLSARPGITGLWQVSGRSDTSYAQRVALDIAYVRDWSLWMDAAIVARTIPAVLKRKGAV